MVASLQVSDAGQKFQEYAILASSCDWPAYGQTL